MRRILVSCGLLALLALPAAAAARTPASAKPGYLVVRRGLNDRGVNGRPAVTAVVKGFVLGRISQEARVDVYHLPSGGVQARVKGTDVSTSAVRWHGANGFRLTGKEYSGSNLRFRVTGGPFRLVVRGAGIYLFAGGTGAVWLRGSSVYTKADGKYWLNNGTGRSMPTTRLKLKIGGG
jgi:hypothetical protein